VSGAGENRPGRSLLDRAKRWGPEVFFLAITSVSGLRGGGRWLDPTGDPGLWWSLAERLAHGERYYRDVFLQYGPLSPYLISFSGRPFEFSATWFLLINWIPAIGAGFLLLLVSRPFLNSLERVVLAGGLLGLSVFAPGPGRLVLSYCPAAVHALCFSLGAFLLLQSRRNGWLPACGAGALAGLAACAKQEIGVAALLGLCAPMLTQRRRAFRWIAGCVAGFLAVALLGVSFVLASGASFDSLRYGSHVWPIGSAPPEWRALFRGVAGLAGFDWRESILAWGRELLKLITLVSLLGLLLARERRSQRWWPTLGVAAFLLVNDLLTGRDPLPNVRPIGLSMTAAFLLVVAALMDRRRQGREFLLGFGLFAGLIGIRTAFAQDTSGHYTGVAHFSTTLTWALLLLCVVPNLLPGGGRPAQMARRAWALVLLPIAWYGAVIGIESLGDRIRVAVETRRGRVWMTSRIAEFYARIGKELVPGERVLFVPETYGGDVLFDLRNVSPFLLHAPGWLDLRAEEILIHRLESNSASAVVLFDRPTGEFRVKPFGIGFGRLLSAWIDRHYAVVVSLRAGKILRWKPPPAAELLENDRRLTGDEPHRGLEHPLEPEKERKGPGRSDASEPDASRKNVEKGSVVSHFSQGKVGILALETSTIPFENDPRQRDVGSRESACGGKAPILRGFVIRLDGEEPVEAFPKPGVSGLDQNNPPARSEGPLRLAKEGSRVWQVVEHVEHEDRGDRVVRKVDSLGTHHAVQVRLEVKIGRNRLRQHVLDEPAARPDLDDGPLRTASEAPPELPVMLSVERSEKRLALDELVMNSDELRRIVAETADLRQLEFLLEPRRDLSNHRNRVNHRKRDAARRRRFGREAAPIIPIV
jgi:hypothetical protein